MVSLIKTPIVIRLFGPFRNRACSGLRLEPRGASRTRDLARVHRLVPLRDWARVTDWARAGKSAILPPGLRSVIHPLEVAKSR